MATATIDETTQYLTFKLDNETFAIDISKVREVLEFTTLTRVPRMPQYMRGAINLRGSVVPVLDLRLKFGLPMVDKTVNTCIIITEINIGDESMIIGTLVDSVQEVMDIEPENVEPAPRIGTRVKADFIRGMGKHNDNFIIILSIDKVFSEEELSDIQTTGLETAEL